jgi:hypothetical protein
MQHLVAVAVRGEDSPVAVAGEAVAVAVAVLGDLAGECRAAVVPAAVGKQSSLPCVNLLVTGTQIQT